MLGRYWAMQELVGQFYESENVEAIVPALRESAEKDIRFENRREAIQFLRAMLIPPTPPGMEPAPVKLDPATAAVALKAAKDVNSLVRADAIEFLGRTLDPKYAPLYTAALSDPSYTVIENAAEALGKTKVPGAYESIVKLTSTPSWRGRIQIAGLNGLGALGDKRAFELAYKTATDKSVSQALRDGALEAVGTTGRGDARAYPLIFEKFKKGLDAGNEGVLLRTVNAIIKLGDPRGQEAFDMLRVKYKDDAEIMGIIEMFEKQFKEGLGK